MKTSDAEICTSTRVLRQLETSDTNTRGRRCKAKDTRPNSKLAITRNIHCLFLVYIITFFVNSFVCLFGYPGGAQSRRALAGRALRGRVHASARGPRRRSGAGQLARPPARSGEELAPAGEDCRACHALPAAGPQGGVGVLVGLRCTKKSTPPPPSSLSSSSSP